MGIVYVGNYKVIYTLFDYYSSTMDNDQALGYIIFIGSLAVIGIYFWLLFFTTWSWLVIQASAMIAVAGVLAIMAWIGYTLATTPPPMPLEDMDFDFDDEPDLEEEETESVEPEEVE